jgi:pyridoxal phosphate enzyme (YggS family)
MSDIAANLADIRSRITAACHRAGRDPASVELIAVSKTFPADAVREASQAGQLTFGESKLQEAETKIDVLPGSLHWHFIGRVQRNKVRKILSRFEVVHAIDSLRLAQYTDETAGELGLFPRVFLQVNIGGEESKGGFVTETIRREIGELLSLKRLEVAGLMCIPPPGPEAEDSRRWFVALRELRDGLERDTGVPLPALSMGMSGDFEVAIEEGATHLRVGSSIFGKRSYRVDGELGG